MEPDKIFKLIDIGKALGKVFSIAYNADRIIVIDKGTVREQGTHDELIANSDEYARLFNLQAEGYK